MAFTFIVIPCFALSAAILNAVYSSVANFWYHKILRVSYCRVVRLKIAMIAMAFIQNLAFPTQRNRLAQKMRLN